MTALRRTLGSGDLLEIRSAEGVAYVQVVGKHPEYGFAVYVFPRFYPDRLEDFGKLTQEEGYVAFYPAQAAAREGLVKIVGHGQLPFGIEVPAKLRRAGARAPSGEVLTWVIEDGGQESVRKQLQEGEKQIPIAAIWNHELLVERISNRWRPEQET